MVTCVPKVCAKTTIRFTVLLPARTRDVVMVKLEFSCRASVLMDVPVLETVANVLAPALRTDIPAPVKDTVMPFQFLAADKKVPPAPLSTTVAVLDDMVRFVTVEE